MIEGMPSMAVATSQYIKAIPLLPNRVELLVREAPWEEYEQLLEDLGPKTSTRVFYNQGRMWIVPPLSAGPRFPLGAILSPSG